MGKGRGKDKPQGFSQKSINKQRKRENRRDKRREHNVMPKKQGQKG